MKWVFRNEIDRTEVWRDVVGYEGLYMVSNKGRVRCLFRENDFQHCYISLTKAKGGYILCRLRGIDGKAKNLKVHRLVAFAFIPLEEGKPFINHKDENPSNNKVGNLEWCTHKYNMNYGTIKERKTATFRKTIEKRRQQRGNFTQ